MRNSDSEYLIDSNVLLYLVNVHSEFHVDARRCLVALEMEGARLFYAPQNVTEFWAIATRPLSHRGLGFELDEVLQQLDGFASRFSLIAESAELFVEWRKVALESRSTGRHVFDARLAAAMKLNGISKIITKNSRDFRRFVFVQAFEPEDIVAGKR